MRQFSLAVLLVLVTQLSQSAPCDAPAKLADGWPVEASAVLAGFDQTRLCDLLHDFADSKVNFHSLVIERHGRLVAEAYKRGKDESINTLFASSTNFETSTRRDIRSISKSVVSLLWGIAQADGKTPPLNTPMLDLLPALVGLNNQGREATTIAHLMTMSSGLGWNEPSAYNSRNDELGLYWRLSQSRYLFDRPMAAPTGSRNN